MTTEQPTDSGASIEDRLLASFAPEAAEPEAPAETQEPAAELLDTDGDNEQAAPEESTDDLVEVEAEDGTAYKVPAALKDGYLRQADYTRKAQQVAVQTAQVVDKEHYLEAREQISEAIAVVKAQRAARAAELKQLENVDYSQLDQVTVMRIRDRRDDLRREVEQADRNLMGAESALEKAAQQHRSKKVELAERGITERLGRISDSDKAGFHRHAAELGFTQDELTGPYADAKILHAIYNSYKRAAAQPSKAKALAEAAKAPPIVKPGASKGPGVAAEQKYRDARDALKKSGSVDAAARLFYLRG